jgi:hypothetical protein
LYDYSSDKSSGSNKKLENAPNKSLEFNKDSDSESDDENMRYDIHYKTNTSTLLRVSNDELINTGEEVYGDSEIECIILILSKKHEKIIYSDRLNHLSLPTWCKFTLDLRNLTNLTTLILGQFEEFDYEPAIGFVKKTKTILMDGFIGIVIFLWENVPTMTNDKYLDGKN